MYTKEELSVIVEEYIRGLKFPDEPDTLYEPIVYSLEAGGKRIRPLLAVMAANVFSDDISKSLPISAAVEVFHNFTLLHDDIMDNASVRRGRPSVHKKWGENVAILSGDAMMIYSFRLLEGADAQVLPAMLNIFTDMSLKVCEGQQHDMDFEQLENVSTEDYLHMISYKTAILLAGSAVLGAMSVGASRKDCDLIYNFGMDLGIAFQIQDDILDSYGDSETFGKKTGGDIMEGKKTFLTTKAMEIADEKTKYRLMGLLHNKEMIPEQKIDEVVAIYDTLGIRKIAEEAVEYYTRNAVRALSGISAGEQRTELMRQLALELTTRMK